jgi:hypothetical protein
LFFATTRIKHQPKQLRPMFLFFATTRIKHQPKQLKPMFFVLLQQQESNIKPSNWDPCFFFFANNKNRTSTV